MSRQIKFRGWHSKNSQMFSADIMAQDQLTILTTGSFINGHGGATSKSVVYDKSQFIPLQFTGLHDKHGVEIYEGDMCHLDDVTIVGSSDPWPERRIILFDPEYAKFDNFRINYERGGSGLVFCKANTEKFYAVVGNIYEHPELLGAYRDYPKQPILS